MNLFDKEYYDETFTRVVIDLGKELSSGKAIPEVVSGQIKFLKRRLSEVELMMDEIIEKK